MTSTQNTKPGHFGSFDELYLSMVHVGCAVLLLHSLGAWLELVALAKVSWWSWWVAGGVALASAIWWRPLDATYAVKLRRLILLPVLALAGPVWLFVYGMSATGTATLDFFVIQVTVAMLLAPELVLWRRIWEQWNASRLAAMAASTELQTHTGAPLRPWLLIWGKISATLLFLPLLVPYAGRLATHTLLVAVWALWLLVDKEATGTRRWLAAALASASCLFGVFAYQLFPMPHVVYGNEIVYTAFVAGNPVTLHARRSESGSVFMLTTKNAVLHQTLTSYRQSEMLTHPAMLARANKPARILILGSEDGGVLREVSRYKHKMEVVWVPLYPHWRTFFRHAPLLKRQLVANQPHVTLHQLPPLASLAESDFALWVDTMQGETFDVVIADFPTADGGTKGLFTPESARQLFRLVKPSGVAAVHLTSPYQHPSLYWCLVGQFANMRLHVAPYRLGPSLYRDFGYVIVSRKPLTRLSRSLNIPVKTKYLYQKQDFSMLQRFPKDMRPDGRSMLRGCVFPPVPAMR